MKHLEWAEQKTIKRSTCLKVAEAVLNTFCLTDGFEVVPRAGGVAGRLKVVLCTDPATSAKDTCLRSRASTLCERVKGLSTGLQKIQKKIVNRVW